MTAAKQPPIHKPERIEQRPLAALVPYARNARTHSAQQVQQIVDSVRAFGWTNPILIDAEDGIIAGHGRVLAAEQLGMDAVPCIRLDHLTDAQRRAYILADNQLALNAGWDDELLAMELRDLQVDDFDLGLIGFSDDELSELMARVDSAPGQDGTDGDTDGQGGGIDYEEHFAVLVECKNEPHQAEVFESLKTAGYSCKVLVN